MDYELLNLRTGEVHGLHPYRNLIGTASQATIRTQEGGPFLASLIVRYPAGWAIHGLCDDPCVTFNGKPLRVTRKFVPLPNDVLEVGDDRFRFVAGTDASAESQVGADSPPSCFAYVSDPQGMEECRVVDHNLLVGRLRICHVRYPDTKLSRLHALLASHAGCWYVHPLSNGQIARNRQLVSGFALLADGDELLIGPLAVRIELRTQTETTPNTPFDTSVEGPGPDDSTPSGTSPSITDLPTITVESNVPVVPPSVPGRTAIYAAGVRLDYWLKAQKPSVTPKAGLGAGRAQRDRLKRFWYDTPETTSARILRNAERMEEAFAVLDRAIRARPDSPDLLRELYRLYDAVGLVDLCYRPLRAIERLAVARGESDTWVYETLAQLCARLAPNRPDMLDRAVGYWNKLERATGVSYAQERAAAMALRTARNSGLAKITDEED